MEAVTVKEYSFLPMEAKEIRTRVFVEEQGFVEEFDATDAAAVHLVAFVGQRAVGTCRVFYHEDRKSYVIGRVAVDRDMRGKNIGAGLLVAAETLVKRQGGSSICLDAQVRAAQFYEKSGYRKDGEIFLEEGCPHVTMRKMLGE